MTLWYPDAVVCKMAARGNYEKNWPEGCVLHYTAGRNNAVATMKSGAEQGHAYFCINREGVVHQGLPLNEWGSHAGQSAWPDLGVGVSSKLVGIEICSAGKVTYEGPHFKTWYGEKVDASEVRTLTDKQDWGEDGNYQIFTPEQERAVLKLLDWMHQQRPDVFKFEYVLSHHEVCQPPGRKADVGGSLSMPMPKLRELLLGKGFSDYISLP